MANPIECPDCGKEISERAVSCPHCGAPNQEPAPENQDTSAILCPNCKKAMVQKEEKSSVSPAGLFGALLFIIGIACLFFSAPMGIIIMVLGILTGLMSNRTHSSMVCVQCGYKREIPG